MLRSVEVSARLQGSREELWAILADYGRYCQWVPGLDRSSVLAQEGDVVVAEFRGRRFSDRTFNLELIRSPPDAIVFRQIDSLNRPGVSGRFKLGDTEPDVGSTTAVVSLRARLETPLFAVGSRRRMRVALRASLDSLSARRRHLASARPVAEARKQKLLEVVREADGLKVWYLGETFVMPKQGAP